MDPYELLPAEGTWARVQVLLSRNRVKQALALALNQEARTTFGPHEARSFGSAVVMPLDWFPPGWALFVPARQHVVIQMDIVDEFYMSEVMWTLADRMVNRRVPALRPFDLTKWRQVEDSLDDLD
jgi:hypothetical protein